MRVLLTTIGSRGDVQPMVALGRRLQELDHEVRVCAPPDFGDWISGLGIAFTPVGPELATTGKTSPSAAPPTPEQRLQMVSATIAAQFDAITAAASGCDVIVAGGYVVVAARTVAEQLGIRYVWTGFCPIVLPSPHHVQPDTMRYTIFKDPLNAYRESVGLDAVDDVSAHLFGRRPWLAADPTLAPWPGGGLDVVQTGAWLLPDSRPLSSELEAFLEAGEPPVYFGFGSIRAPEELSRTMIQAARALGRRAIVLKGWADLSLMDSQPDCLSIGEVNQQALFRRVAAVVHHGGAGTTTAATHAGSPQVVIPQVYDQPYFAQRVQDLGIGAAHAPGAPTAESLTEALRHTFQPDVAASAKLVADAVRTDGTDVAAHLLLESK